MRFDDSLETVLASDLTGEGARASAWRQLVDLIGRGRSAPDPRAIALLHELRDGVPRTVRVASARDLEYARPPAVLVDLLATDVIEAAVPVLRSATLSVGEWLALLPRLGSAARGVVRNRRDLDPAVQRALDSFGGTDLVLGDDSGEGDVSTPVSQQRHPSEGWGLPPQSDDARPTETPASAGVTRVAETANPPIAIPPVEDATSDVADTATAPASQQRYPGEGRNLLPQSDDARPTKTPASAGVTPVAEMANSPISTPRPRMRPRTSRTQRPPLPANNVTPAKAGVSRRRRTTPALQKSRPPLG
ncbi:hypothetical protein ACVOMT_13275 [Sphingomonas panni]